MSAWTTTPAGIIVPMQAVRKEKPVAAACPPPIRQRLKELRQEFAAKAGRRK